VKLQTLISDRTQNSNDEFPTNMAHLALELNDKPVKKYSLGGKMQPANRKNVD